MGDLSCQTFNYSIPKKIKFFIYIPVGFKNIKTDVIQAYNEYYHPEKVQLKTNTKREQSVLQKIENRNKTE